MKKNRNVIQCSDLWISWVILVPHISVIDKMLNENGNSAYLCFHILIESYSGFSGDKNRGG
ncbi:MAG: hypothetical protein C4527_23585 [Candidatus Omnitrophota bacterium]|nr:MAG: hypothetical protein C4527_23585 [Candidatus Omnitrophota bacterium]